VANIKVSELPDADALTGNEEVMVLQNGQLRKATIYEIRGPQPVVRPVEDYPPPPLVPPPTFFERMFKR
jgi:hypothetical protein